MATKIGGRGEVRINGQQLALRSDLTIMTANVSREAVVGLDTVHGVTEQVVAPWIQFTVSDLASVDLTALQALDDATVSVKLNNGVSYVLRNASQTNQVELNQAEGSYQLKFTGLSIERNVGTPIT